MSKESKTEAARKRGYDVGYLAAESGVSLQDFAKSLLNSSRSSLRTPREQTAYQEGVGFGYLDAQDELRENKKALKW